MILYDKSYCESIYFTNPEDSDSYSVHKHGNYSIGSAKVHVIKDENTGEFYILESKTPVTVYNSQEYKEKRKKEILESLSKEDRAILGYE